MNAVVVEYAPRYDVTLNQISGETLRFLKFAITKARVDFAMSDATSQELKYISGAMERPRDPDFKLK